MIRRLVALTLLILFGFIFLPQTYAANLYTNSLKSDFWNTFYSYCTTSTNGLSCNGTSILNTLQLPTVKCIYVDASSSIGNPQLVFDESPTELGPLVTANFNHNSNIVINVHNTFYDTGISVPNGAHRYGLCQGNNQVFVYIDNSLIYTLNAAFSHLDYIGLNLSPGSTLKNFKAVDPTNTTLYSNSLANDFWNTFFGTCTTSTSGVNCNHTAVMNTLSLSTVKCISFEADSSLGNPQLLFAQNPGLINVIAVDFNNNSDILIKDIYDQNFHTGVLVPNGNHIYSVCQGTNQLSIYLDNSLQYTFNTVFPHLNYIGFTLSNGTTLTNFNASDSLPNQLSLSVPLLKQTDSNWGGQIYDSANLWATAPHQTIGDWGCALTSATMVLQYNKITKLPDGTNLDPGTLNTWLKNQKDGYVGNGLVNWLALSRLSKLAKPQNPNFTADALEYKRKAGADTTTLLADLNAQQPDILEEPGHFVVGTGQSDTSFTINDPYYSRTDLTQGYNNTFLSLGRYIPSHTDLSYMMFVTDESTNLELKDATGSAIGESFDQQPLINDTNDSSGTASGSTLHEYLVPQPPTGTYSLHVSGADNAPYYVKIYMYDKNGNVIDPINLSGFLDGVGSHTSEVVFDNQSISNDFTITNVPITIDTFMEDLIHYEQTGDIKGGFLSAINILADNAKNFMLKFNTKITKVQLRVIQGLVTIFHNKGVSNDAYNVLNFELQYLLNNL